MSKLSLDIGCGAGYPHGINQYFPDTEPVGVDVYKFRNMDVMADAQYLPFQDDTFQNILVHHVLEHVKNDTLALSEMRRVLVDGGNLLLIVPNYYCHRQILFRFLAKFIYPIERVICLVVQKPQMIRLYKSVYLTDLYGYMYYTDRTHRREYKFEEIVKLVKKAGFKVIHIKLYGVLLPFYHFLPNGIRIAWSDEWDAGKYSHCILVNASNNSD